MNNLDTRFEFRNYYFLTLLIALSVIEAVIAVYINSDYLVILINRAFLLKQALKIYIYIITSSISVRGININYYSTNEYILLKVYLSKTRNGIDIRVKIIREAHLIDDLKIRMLLSTDIIKPKKIDIIIFKNQAYIESYDTTIQINLKPRTRGVIIKPVIAE